MPQYHSSIPDYSPAAALETAGNAAVVTPHDTDELDQTCAALRIGGAGDVVVVHAGNGAEITYACAAGEILRVKTKLVKATGTTATNIVAWW